MNEWIVKLFRIHLLVNLFRIHLFEISEFDTISPLFLHLTENYGY